MAYSGTLETTKFGEDASGLALVVDVDERLVRDGLSRPCRQQQHGDE